MSVKEAPPRYSTIKELVITARTVFPLARPHPENNPISVRHTKIDPYVPVLGYMLQQATPYERPQVLLNKFYTPDGRWNFEGDASYDPYTKSPNELHEYLEKILKDHLKLVDLSLRGVSEYGFNTHGLAHTKSVATRTLQLLQEANADEDTQRRGVLAAWGHDIANAYNRTGHSIDCPAVLRAMVPGVVNNPEQWVKIKRAIILHEPSITWVVIENWKKLFYEVKEKAAKENVVPMLGGMVLDDTVSEEAFLLKRLLDTVGTEGVALIVADKADVGSHRVDDKANARDAVNVDPHIEINLLFKTEGVYFDPTKRELVWNLQYTPTIAEEEAERLRNLVRKRSNHKDEKPRVIVSDGTQELYRKKSIPHFASVESAFWNLYFERTKLLAYAALALFPQIEAVSIVLTDEKVLPTSKRAWKKLEFPIERGEVEVFFEHLKTVYNRVKGKK